MSWYECPKCGRKLASAEVYEAKCRDCGDIVILLRGKKTIVNLNTASKQELLQIVGLGPKTAERVIRYRPYRDVSELLRVAGIGKKTYERIKYSLYVK